MNNNPYGKKLGNAAPGAKPVSSDDDLYGGYDLGSNADAIASTVSKTRARANPNAPSAAAPAAVAPAPSVRPPTGFNQGAEGPRPMTSVKGAGYTSQGNKAKAFDPFMQGSTHGPAPPLEQKKAATPEQQAKEMEKVVGKLIEESAMANSSGNLSQALEKAKEAGKKERALCKHREKSNQTDQMNFDLTYAVLFNLANQYHANQMYGEALNTYSIVVKNKQYPQAGRLRVNMGNIYYEQKKYPSAIKMYRMAMDLIGTTSREMRFKIMRNIGNAFVRLGQFQDAIQSYEEIMNGHGDPQTGFNLVVCYYARGDKEKMKKGFSQLLNCEEYGENDNEEEEEFEQQAKDILKNNVDELTEEIKNRKKATARYLRMAAKLIAPVIEKDLASGYDWVIEYLRTPRSESPRGTQNVSASGFPAVAMEIEIAKGIAFMKRKDIKAAIEVFKSFEKKDQGLIDQAATNLSFLYFLEGDMRNAEKHANLAVQADRYNAKALVNKANYLYVKGALEQAKELYLEAIGVEADCVEAIYNLGLTNKRLDNFDDALQAFRKLHRIIPKDPQVIYHIANLYDLLEENAESAKWFKILHGSVPSDPKVLARLGTLYNKEDDETQAFQNFSDSYQAYPVNMEVISWLGVWYVKSELYEDAIQFFERAAEIEPQELKWQLMVASCHRRMGAFQQALNLYKKIHRQDQDNIECLRYLVAICKDVNDQGYDEYSKALRKAERLAQQKESAYMRDEAKDIGQMYDGQGANGQADGNMAGSRPQAHGDDFASDIAPQQKQGPTINQNNKKDEEDWGDDLGDDLLPGMD